MNDDFLLCVKDINMTFKSKGRVVKAVKNLSFNLSSGETLALVGESGCGKSTMGRVILRLIEADSGEIWFKNKNILKLGNYELRKIRTSMQIVFQDPYGSLNPRMTVRKLISEAVESNISLTKTQVALECERILKLVELNVEDLDKYPHQFSGGQRQRIGISRAIATNPELIICDEPVSALDLLVQSQMLNLLNDLQRKQGFSYIFISHDLSVVRHMSDRIAIMYEGEIIEIGKSEEIFKNAKHPYTKILLSSVLSIASDDCLMDKEIDNQHLNVDQSSCQYSSYCQNISEKCNVSKILLRKISETHFVACMENN